MRIISGTAKGRKLFSPSGYKTTRPTSDRAREALFSILGNRVINSRVLDLFAGTGAFGCEALSRGAQSSCFIENDTTALKLIEKNILLVPEGLQRSTVIKYNLNKGLPNQLFNTQHSRFELIFADPPYLKGFSEKILNLLDSSSILSEQVLVIIEEKKNVALPLKFKHLTQFDVRRYGDSDFSFYSFVNYHSIIRIHQ